MSTVRTVGRVLALATALALVAPAAVVSTSGATPSTHDSTSPREARRVDRVPTPNPRWFDCETYFGPGTECATVRLPLDYDRPKGKQTSVAMLRIQAADPERKIGTLFLNPGGPGGSGVGIAASAPYFLPPEILARFDILGFDPRGTNFSRNVRCFENIGQQTRALSGMNVAFPWKAQEERDYVTSARRLGRACSSVGAPLSRSMSTAEVARDMDVLRRAVGDRELTYAGFSYGTYLGNVYANLFPDRVRAMVVDGVLDPIAWAGRPRNNDLPSTVRLKSGEGSAKALREILRRCGDAGPQFCMLASFGDPLDSYADIIRSLKRHPLVITDPEFGETFTFTYATLVAFLTGDLYSPQGSALVDNDLTAVRQLLGAADARAGSPDVRRARSWLLHQLRSQRSAERSAEVAHGRQGRAFGFGFPYDNMIESFSSVLCTDGLNPANARDWRRFADVADDRAPDFGRYWTWPSASCASNTWTARDEDRYRGPFDRRTVHPVLVVGNYWDPATNYQGAVKVAKLLPNSRLLSSDSWGHTAYNTSACVTDAVTSYVLRGVLPAEGTVCVGDAQPFTDPLSGPGYPRRSGPPSRPLPPVVPPFPGALPRT